MIDLGAIAVRLAGGILMPILDFTHRLSGRGWACLCTVAALSVATPAMGQERGDDGLPPVAAPPRATKAENSAGFVANSAFGRVGQRQVRGQFQGIKPMAGVDNRFANRVQNRISNRIDRYYNPNGSTTSSFTAAANQVKVADPRSRQ